MNATRRPTLSRRTAVCRLGGGGLAAVFAAAGLTREPRVAAQEATAVPPPFLPDIVREWFGAWEADDSPRRLAALYIPDGSHCDVPSRVCAVEGDEIEGFVRATLAGLRDARRHMRGSFAVAGWAAVEQLFTATNRGLFSGAAEGAPFQVYAVTIFQIVGARIGSSTDYYDVATILTQLGVLPRPGAGETVPGLATRR